MSLLNLRIPMAGALLAAFLIACSEASPTPGAGLVATASPVPPGQQSEVAPDLAATLAPTEGGLVATATLVAAEVALLAPGQSVSLGGTVTEILSPMLFELRDTAQPDGVLVLVPTGSFNVGEGQLVQVAGVVQEFDAAQLEQSLGVNIDDSLAASFAGRPVVIADQIDATIAGP